MKNLGQIKKAELENYEIENLKYYKYFGYMTIGHYGMKYSSKKELFFSDNKFEISDKTINNRKTEKITFYLNK